MQNKRFVFFLFTLLMFNSYGAYAYIEPGFGSLLIQALLGGFVGGMVILKSYWYKISSLFSSKKNK